MPALMILQWARGESQDQQIIRSDMITQVMAGILLSISAIFPSGLTAAEEERHPSIMPRMRVEVLMELRVAEDRCAIAVMRMWKLLLREAPVNLARGFKAELDLREEQVHISGNGAVEAAAPVKPEEMRGGTATMIAAPAMEATGCTVI
jgi:hypothetical protein